MLTTAESTRILHPARIFTAGPRGPLTAVGLRFTFIFPLPFSLLDLISRTSSSSIMAYSLVFLMHPSVALGKREMGFFFFSDHLGTWLIKYHTSQVLTLWLRNASLSQLMKNHLSRSFAFLLICLKNIEILLCGTISVFFFFFLLLEVFHMEYYAFRGFGFDIFTLQIPSSKKPSCACSTSCSFLFLSRTLTIMCRLCDNIFEHNADVWLRVACALLASKVWPAGTKHRLSALPSWVMS